MNRQGELLDRSRTRRKAYHFEGAKPCPGLNLPDLKRPEHGRISANKMLCAECADLLREASRKHQEEQQATPEADGLAA